MREITSEDEFLEVLRESFTKLVVVKFFAEWCGPCKRIGPEFVQLSEQYNDILCAEINVEILESTTEELEIAAMPTFIAFYKGEKVDEVVGGNLDILKEMIEKHRKT